MAFDGTEGTIIPLSEGAQLTKNYRDRNPGAVKAIFYGREHLEAILSQEGCMGIRIYYGMSNSGAPQLVLAGADADENDLLEVIVDTGTSCPPNCSSNNALNS